MKIYNYDEKNDLINPVRVKNAPRTPCRILICGATACGKTNLALNLIYNLLPWSKLYVFAKDPTEAKYQSLQEACELASEIDPFEYSFDTELSITVDDLDSSEHSLIIFDDFITSPASFPAISDFFIRGRKKNATVVFLTQSYFNTPKPLRLQCNYYIFFRSPDHREIGELYKNHPCGLSKEDFKITFHRSTNDHNFLVLDVDEGKIGKNFT